MGKNKYKVVAESDLWYIYTPVYLQQIRDKLPFFPEAPRTVLNNLLIIITMVKYLGKERFFPYKKRAAGFT